jgi:hypothetical protein
LNAFKNNPKRSMKNKLIFTALLALCYMSPLSAQTLTLTAGSAEIASSNVKNHLYGLSDLYFIYNQNTEIIEARHVETKASVFKSNISNLTISGLTTAAQKLAWIGNTHLKANTAQFNYLLPKNGIAVRYNVSGKSTHLLGRYAKGDVALWSGHVDSIKFAVADSTTALRLAALRKIVRGSTPQLIGNDAAAPTIAAGAAAGSGATASITGNGLSGEIDIDTGSSTTTTGVLATVTLPVACPNGCRVALWGSSSFGATQAAKIFTTGTSSTFVLNAAGTAVTASTADLKYFYTVTCY